MINNVMELETIKQMIEPLAKKVIEQTGTVLVELNVTGHRNDIHIQVLADKPGGGINVRECVIINKSLVASIEQEKLLPREIFSLEVSSPGIDRHK